MLTKRWIDRAQHDLELHERQQEDNRQAMKKIHARRAKAQLKQTQLRIEEEHDKNSARKTS